MPSTLCRCATWLVLLVLALRCPAAEPEPSKVLDLSLLVSIRRQLPRAHVILMTAFGTSELVRDALDLGAFRVIGKPFDLEEFSDLVGEAALLSSGGTSS